MAGMAGSAVTATGGSPAQPTLFSRQRRRLQHTGKLSQVRFSTACSQDSRWQLWRLRSRIPSAMWQRGLCRMHGRVVKGCTAHAVRGWYTDFGPVRALSSTCRARSGYCSERRWVILRQKHSAWVHFRPVCVWTALGRSAWRSARSMRRSRGRSQQRRPWPAIRYDQVIHTCWP
jgi:hypothetical protein